MTSKIQLDESKQNSFYNQFGGEKAIDVAVEMFYEKVLSDPELMGFFEQTNMIFQKKHQKDFITYLTGGTKLWKGKNMRTAHEHLN
jgi:hemoglobin